MTFFDELTPSSEHKQTRKKLYKQVCVPRTTLILHSPGWFFINGTSWRVKGLDAKLLIRLAQEGSLSATSITQASPQMQTQLQTWIEDGWLIQK